MISNKKKAARRKLLGILPRAALEDLSQLDRVHTATKRDLINAAVSKWDADEVAAQIQSIIRRAASEGC